MNLDQTAAIRIAICETVNQLRPPVMCASLPELTRTALQAHLDALLKAELQALTGQAQGGEKTSISIAAATNDLQAELTRIQGAIAELRVAKYGEPTPWYPDDSGEWVEVPDDRRTCPLPPATPIDVLCRKERVNKKWNTCAGFAGGFEWNVPPESSPRIVAYKVVKP